MIDLEELIDNIQEELEYEYSILTPRTKKSLALDLIYRKAVTNLSEVRRFNFHDDYWGCAEVYQEQNETAMKMLKPVIGKVVDYCGQKVKVIAMLIDKQYNSIGHTDLLVEEVAE